jgi:hypothetical protein
METGPLEIWESKWKFGFREGTNALTRVWWWWWSDPTRPPTEPTRTETASYSIIIIIIIISPVNLHMPPSPPHIANILTLEGGKVW